MHRHYQTSGHVFTQGRRYPSKTTRVFSACAGQYATLFTNEFSVGPFPQMVFVSQGNQLQHRILERKYKRTQDLDKDFSIEQKLD